MAKNYKVLVDFEMAGTKYEVGQEIELDARKTKALLENKAIEEINPPAAAPASTGTGKTAEQPDAPEGETSIIKQLMQEIKDMKATQDMLMQTADKKLLAQYYAKNQKKMPKEFRLNVINDKVIVLMHDMPLNTVGKNPATKQWFEDQYVEVVLEDDSIVKMTYQAYITSYRQVTARLLAVKVDEMTDEAIATLLRLDNGKEYNINVKYLN